jgi:acyl-coenzyme A synthetase/AMP-(fatty) acid ligase/acyl carrier protein
MHRADFTEDDVVLQKTPYGFDVAVGETFAPLTMGGRLVLARPEGHRDPACLLETIRRERVTVAEFVPAMLQVFLDEPGVSHAAASLRLVIASGEALSRELQDRFFSLLGAELHNVYGPTEAGEVTTWACDRQTPLHTAGVPLGRPLANFRIYVLDASGQPVPVGARGEVFIGGVGVARGYLHRPGATAERFVPDPFSDRGERLYRTGDIARQREDGVLEYLGRADAQVKIRGFRVEPGEIESFLKRQDQVKDAVVVVREDRPGERRLVAYVVASGSVCEGLRALAREHLPDFMVPSAFVAVDGLPSTPNGKIDRRALPVPERPDADPAAAGVPETDTERRLLGIWSDLLGVAEIGLTEDFFELGGNSLSIVKLAARVRDAFGVGIPQHELFEAPTVRELAERIDQTLAKTRIAAGDIPRTDERVAHARVILEDPRSSAAAKLGAKHFLETVGRD